MLNGSSPPLKERFADAVIVGEEACSDNESLLDGLGDTELAFTIDPVDGTFNFASGVPLFGVMLAVVSKGETVAGIIHDPVGNDWIMASKGGGTYIRHSNGEASKVSVAEPASINQMIGSISWQYTAEPMRSRLARNHTKFLSQIGYRCAAHEYRIIATGGAHFAVYNKLMPWDHLPGALIHQEAGGYLARWDGSAYLPSTPAAVFWWRRAGIAGSRFRLRFGKNSRPGPLSYVFGSRALSRIILTEWVGSADSQPVSLT